GTYADEWVAGLKLAASTGTRRSSATTSAPSSARSGSTSSPPRGSPATTANSKTTAATTNTAKASHYRPTRFTRWALNDHDDDEYLLPRHPNRAAVGRRPLRRPSGQGLALSLALPTRKTPNPEN